MPTPQKPECLNSDLNHTRSRTSETYPRTRLSCPRLNEMSALFIAFMLAIPEVPCDGLHERRDAGNAGCLLISGSSGSYSIGVNVG